MAELNYPSFVFENELWLPSQQAFVCRMCEVGANVDRFSEPYRAIVKNGDCKTFLQDYDIWQEQQKNKPKTNTVG